MRARRPLKITSRTSSVANAFVQAILPVLESSESERAEALGILGMTINTICCAYCGATCTDWDHFRPLVRNGRPTGFMTEPRNLVPACGPCNQSKSGSDWRKWMDGNARGSPRARGVPDIDGRIERLIAFEKWGDSLPQLFWEELVPQNLLDSHWNNLADIKERMHAAQRHADLLRTAIQDALERQRTSRHAGVVLT